MSDKPMTIEKRAASALHEAFCRLRYFVKYDLNDQGKEHLFLVADAAHNIPLALVGDLFHAPHLELYVASLEEFLREPYTEAIGKYLKSQGVDKRMFSKLLILKRVLQAMTMLPFVFGLWLYFEYPDWFLNFLLGHRGILFLFPVVFIGCAWLLADLINQKMAEIRSK